jgi:HAD superfamily hydrolase (TIGR01509 family)
VIGALLWDVDGTLAETERDGHLQAFNRAFLAHGVPWRWSEAHYGGLLAVAGGRERLLHDMQQRGAPADLQEREQLAATLHRLKNEHYARIVKRGELPLRAGVRELLEECAQAGVPMAIATTTSRCNVEALLGAQLGPRWAARFAAIVCAEQAPVKKPDPAVYRLALAGLGIEAAAAVAIEDAPAGIEAARRAGIPVLTTASHYFPQRAGTGALASGPSLGSAAGWTPAAESGARITLGQIARWRAASDPQR